MATDDDLNKTKELYAFLQGEVPASCSIAADDIPRLTPVQAWTVIWYLGNQYWRVTDCVERCGECGELFDTERGGQIRETEPFNLCDNCARYDEDETDD